MQYFPFLQEVFFVLNFDKDNICIDNFDIDKDNFFSPLTAATVTVSFELLRTDNKVWFEMKNITKR